tara:strand:+ start:3696 stop:4112 length:417 start_codon:yes stop_codon:yes gene_type:complete
MPKKRKKSLTRKRLIHKLDTVFSLYIRLKNADHGGFCKCYTCDRKYHWKKIHCGHFMSRKNFSTRWEEDNVATQCVGCNLFKHGEQYIFGLKLGKELSEKLYLKSKKIVKFTDDDLNEMIEKFNNKVLVLKVKNIDIV